ncbi:MAG: response regulator [Desulfuromusa sp.]|nr:response regulator [Desulfuromusa sp.]
MKGYKIYIVDDDPATYDILSEYLESAGFKVRAAFDGREGLDIMRDDPPDLALLDIQMPEMDGFQLLEAMRRQESLQDVPVLFITSLDRTNLKIKGLELGADDFIVKPFERAELFARIKAALRRSDRYRLTESILTGNLADISLTELLQTLDIGRKTARIKFPEMLGEVFVDRGMLVSAQQGEFSGEAALTRLLFLNAGSFVVDFGMTTKRRDGKNISIQHQVLNSLVRIDTVERKLAEFPERNPIIDKIPAIPLLSNIDNIVELLPLPLIELLIILPGDLALNTELFLQEYR